MARKPLHQLLTIREAAYRWNVSEKTMRRLINAGTVPSTLIPSPIGKPLVRIDPTDLQRLEERFTGAA